MDNQKTLFDTVLANGKSNNAQKYINFSIGAPSNNLMPLELVRKAWKESIDIGDQELCQALQYGPSRGDSDILEQLAEFLRYEYSDDKVAADHLVLTSGASQSLSNLIITFADYRHTTIFIEDPAYFLVYKLFQDVSPDFDITLVQQEDDGLDVDLLARHLSSTADHRSIQDGKFQFILYTVPSFNNPTGSVLSDSKRQSLSRLVNDYNLLVICDDVYEMLHFCDNRMSPVPKRLLSYCPEVYQTRGAVISNCTFSKILSPGIRLGWIECRNTRIVKAIEDCGVAGSGGGFNHFNSVTMLKSMLSADSCAMPLLSSHLVQLRSSLKLRSQVMLDSLQTMVEELNQKVLIQFNGGGYFVWVVVKDDKFDAGRFQEYCLANPTGESIISSFTPGSKFTLQQDNFKNALRSCFAFYDQDQIIEGVRYLTKSLVAFLAQQS
ncbi:hypothetical protein MP228_007715 [Amoeboaphelidium protococcarum]|nr:hypothetical protein MP228_007715 [Amoeboaphelidium protococcarum]